MDNVFTISQENERFLHRVLSCVLGQSAIRCFRYECFVSQRRSHVQNSFVLNDGLMCSKLSFYLGESSTQHGLRHAGSYCNGGFAEHVSTVFKKTCFTRSAILSPSA